MNITLNINAYTIDSHSFSRAHTNIIFSSVYFSDQLNGIIYVETSANSMCATFHIPSEALTNYRMSHVYVSFFTLVWCAFHGNSIETRIIHRYLCLFLLLSNRSLHFQRFSFTYWTSPLISNNNTEYIEDILRTMIKNWKSFWFIVERMNAAFSKCISCAVTKSFITTHKFQIEFLLRAPCILFDQRRWAHYNVDHDNHGNEPN